MKNENKMSPYGAQIRIFSFNQYIEFQEEKEIETQPSDRKGGEFRQKFTKFLAPFRGRRVYTGAEEEKSE